MAEFLFLRARGHRPLLAAALLAILLTTTVLATLAAFTAAVGDAGMRHALRTRDAAAAALVIKAEDPRGDRATTAREAARGARAAFDGLPVTLRRFDVSGPYGLPVGLRPRDARGGDPDLTHFAAADRSRVTLTRGTWPTAPASARGVVPVALPEAAARPLGLAPGPRVVALKDRLGGPPVRIRVTGLYRPADATDPYWTLDALGGRGVRKDVYTTYGPLLADPAALTGGQVRQGGASWLATADFSRLTADRVDALREAARDSQELLAAQPSLGGGVTTRTALPETLDQVERSLLVSRATLLIVTLQLVLLAGYALLLVARLLSTERAAETRVLLARGASRTRLARLAAAEALVVAAPAAVGAPLLAGPLTELLAGRGLLARIGLTVETGLTPLVVLTGVAVALACAAAVVAPALSASRERRGRARSLPGPLRAGGDLALVALAAVAYWQLERRTSGGGALSGDAQGTLGIDPLLVVAPTLLLLAGTVVALRLLPPLARLAERRAARGRGLTVPLAGWQFSRRPLRGAGPVLLLVLAVALGMLAIGQGASWDRSQDDQADFRAGAPVRVLGGGSVQRFGQGGVYDSLPGVRAAVPAARTPLPLSGGRQATVLGLDTTRAGAALPFRADLADGDPQRLIAGLRPPAGPRGGTALPPDTARLAVDLTLSGGTGADAGDPFAPDTTLTVTVEDRFGVPYRMPQVSLTAGTGPRTAVIDLMKAADAPLGRPAGPLTVTALELGQVGYPIRITPSRLTLRGLRSLTADGTARPVAADPAARWRATIAASVPPADPSEREPAVSAVRGGSGAPLTIDYHQGRAGSDVGWGSQRITTLRVVADRGAPPVPAALATERYLESTAAKVGSTLDIPMPGGPLRVRVTGVLRALPTTGPEPAAPGAGPGPGDGGALLVDLRAANQALAARPDASFAPTEWWLLTEPGAAAEVTAALRARAEIDPGQIQSRDEIAAALHDDPIGAGPQSALLAVTAVAAALAAVGFAVATAGALRARTREFAVLRALGAPRRQLARLLAVEQSLLISLALLIGLGLGTVLTRAVVPLVVLTGQATQPVPTVLVELPLTDVALLLAAVAAVPVAIVAALALRRGETAAVLRTQGTE
ncbi:FtsX-like permease family protein [Streptomyces sp. NPDC057638]|uniref:FtsX-like permease family protein n=1 Tax=Streptomyces sp. NPDC057638 TaxID=3346190 RepID=UPI00369F5F66